MGSVDQVIDGMDDIRVRPRVDACPVAQKDRVMHAALRVGSASLMMSDGPPRTLLRRTTAT